MIVLHTIKCLADIFHGAGVLEGPVDVCCFTDDIFLRHRSPEARVVAVSPVVTHDEILAWLQGPVIYLSIIGGGYVIFVQGVSIDNNAVEFDLYSISRDADDPLDEDLSGVNGKMEGDDVAALRFFGYIRRPVNRNIIPIF